LAPSAHHVSGAILQGGCWSAKLGPNLALVPCTSQINGGLVEIAFSRKGQTSRTEPPLFLASSPPPRLRSANCSGDEKLLAWFTNFLGQQVESAHADPSSRRSQARRLEPATVWPYGRAIVTWFAFLADELLLPDGFLAVAAIARANRRMRAHVLETESRESSPEPPEGLEMLIHAFDAPSIDASLPSKERHLLELEGCGIARCSMRWPDRVPK
jgi:hypothetical protein